MCIRPLDVQFGRNSEFLLFRYALMGNKALMPNSVLYGLIIEKLHGMFLFLNFHFPTVALTLSFVRLV